MVAVNIDKAVIDVDEVNYRRAVNEVDGRSYVKLEICVDNVGT